MSIYLLHPAFVHFPIAFLIGASVSGLLYIHWRRLEPLRTLTWWLMVPGWLTLLLAIITGIVSQGALPPDAPYRSLLNWHTTSGLAIAVVYADLLYRGWLYHSGKMRERGKVERGREGEREREGDFLSLPGQRWILTAELLLGIGLVIVSGWLGGELVYTWGANVKLP